MSGKQFKYEASPLASYKIWMFYRHVALKYRHTFDTEDLVHNAQKAIRNMHLIERTLLRRRPAISRWEQEGWHMANAGKWYYAYTIDDETITIQDACHEQNMHEETE